MPYIRTPPFLSIFLLHLSLFFQDTRFPPKSQEGKMRMKSGVFLFILQMSLFLFSVGVHLCALCAPGGLPGCIFVQRCSCFAGPKTGILQPQQERKASHLLDDAA
jgi:hypothetical protein